MNTHWEWISLHVVGSRLPPKLPFASINPASAYSRGYVVCAGIAPLQRQISLAVAAAVGYSSSHAACDPFRHLVALRVFAPSCVDGSSAHPLIP